MCWLVDWGHHWLLKLFDHRKFRLRHFLESEWSLRRRLLQLLMLLVHFRDLFDIEALFDVFTPLFVSPRCHGGLLGLTLLSRLLRLL